MQPPLALLFSSLLKQSGKLTSVLVVLCLTVFAITTTTAATLVSIPCPNITPSTSPDGAHRVAVTTIPALPNTVYTVTDCMMPSPTMLWLIVNTTADLPFQQQGVQVVENISLYVTGGNVFPSLQVLYAPPQKSPTSALLIARNISVHLNGVEVLWDGGFLHNMTIADLRPVLSIVGVTAMQHITLTVDRCVFEMESIAIGNNNKTADNVQLSTFRSLLLSTHVPLLLLLETNNITAPPPAENAPFAAALWSEHISAVMQSSRVLLGFLSSNQSVKVTLVGLVTGFNDNATTGLPPQRRWRHIDVDVQLCDIAAVLTSTNMQERDYQLWGIEIPIVVHATVKFLDSNISVNGGSRTAAAADDPQRLCGCGACNGHRGGYREVRRPVFLRGGRVHQGNACEQQRLCREL
jgi:hypothetical protein